jgi:hypothetical protein
MKFGGKLGYDKKKQKNWGIFGKSHFFDKKS